jgi:CubicO group peptidase (beta-lactamase class C family)
VRKRTLGLLALGIGLLALAVAAITTDRTPEADRILRIENGLLPGTVIAGEPATMSLATRMAHYKVPGVSIAVIDKGDIAWAKGYGVLEAHGTTPVTADTRFQAASVSKPVAAMAALALVQQGRLSLDEDVNLRLASWHVPESEFTKEQKVTLRRLLSHSAGLTRGDVGSYAAGEAVPSLVQTLDGRPPANLPALRVDNVPGSTWRYSGGGYSVMQQLLIDVTGKPFAGLLQEMVLGKIGMAQSTFVQPLPEHWEAIAARGHDVDGQVLKGRWRTFPETAAAGLWTTPSDLARFAMELQRAAQGQSARVLSAETANLMLTKQLNGYGFGAWLGGGEKVTTFSHGGSNEGYRCMLFAYVGTGQGAVVMTNGDGGDGLFNEVMRAIAREYDESGITVSTDRGHLYIAAASFGQEPVRLYPSTADRFFMLEGTLEFSFHKDTQGRVRELQIHAGDQTASAKKLK